MGLVPNKPLVAALPNKPLAVLLSAQLVAAAVAVVAVVVEPNNAAGFGGSAVVSGCVMVDVTDSVAARFAFNFSISRSSVELVGEREPEAVDS